jgi:hypothetical protein
MHPTQVLVRGRLVDRRPLLLVVLLGAITVAGALTAPSPLPLRLTAVVTPVTIVAAAVVASRPTNVVIRRGPLVYVRDRRTNRLVPVPSGARFVCAQERDRNLLLLDAQGRTIARASLHCSMDDARRRLEDSGVTVDVW